jgi:hypothetical protein
LYDLAVRDSVNINMYDIQPGPEGGCMGKEIHEPGSNSMGPVGISGLKISEETLP